ncbi:MAG: hypothetical protein HYY07_02570, partial [Elusimicrobia bacterium]|nr:hypothetical protein [Elusimicrobiota bacterium]
MKTFSLMGALLLSCSLGWSAYSTLDEESRKKFNEILDSAFNAYVNEQYDQALQTFQKALSMDPQDTTALKGLSECKEKIEIRRAERLRLQKEKLELVRKSIKDQDWVNAIDQVYNILQNAPTHAEALSLKSELEQLLRKKMATFPVESSDRMIHEGVLYYLQKRYADAAHVWNEAKSLVSDQVKLSIYIQKAEHLLKEGTEYETLTLGRQRARAALESGNLEEAVNLWKKILEYTPDDEEAKKKFDQAQEMLQKKSRETMLGDYYDKGLTLFLEGNFVESLKYWEAILSISPENEVARDYVK